jgi:hypothetical protein
VIQVKVLLKALAVAAVAVPLVACGSASFSGVPASPVASVPGADKAAAQVIIGQCFPVKAGGAAQLAFATALVNDRQPHLNGTRQRVLTCVGVPQDAAARQKAEGALITDVEHVNWASKASRTVFWDQTLAAWVLASRAAS